MRIDLTAPVGGDPYLYLLTSDGAYLYSDDDGGERRNSRIENDLAPGTYLIEATTYGDRDHVHELTDFDLIIRFVDPDAFHLKAEAMVIPETVVAGQPVVVHYRAGNTGRSDVPASLSAIVYLVTRTEFERTAPIPAAGGLWQAGDSYHAGERAANAASTEIRELSPFEITFGRPGDAGLFIAVATYDDFGTEVDFHGIFSELEVVSGFVFAPVSVDVEGEEYVVAAAANDGGRVTTSATSVGDPEAEITQDVREKAIYAAGVRTQILDGIVRRPAFNAIPESEAQEPVDVESPSSSALLAALAEWHTNVFASSDPANSLAAGDVIIPAAVEELLLSEGESAAAQYASLATEWRDLQKQVSGGQALRPACAFRRSRNPIARRVALAPQAAGLSCVARRARPPGCGRGRLRIARA